MVVFTASWENNESFIEKSFIERCNACMKYNSDSKPHSLTPAKIFAPESRKTSKNVLKLFY